MPRVVRRSKAEIYLHMVWATWQRQPWLVPELERAVYRCIEGETRKLGCNVLAIGGIPDHVHLLVQLHPAVAPARLAQQVKGVSSLLVNDHFPAHSGFRWQESYGVFSVSRSHLERAILYIDNQKQHHASENTWETWEETDQEVEIED